MEEQKIRVLVVDDDKINLLLARALLEPAGCQVIMASDGLEGVQKAIQYQPDVILMDIVMPKLDGIEAVKQLKQNEQTRNIPIAVVTALHDVEHRVKALEAGAEEFIQKPVDRSELIARVRSLSKLKRYHDQLLNYQKQLEEEVQKKTVELRHALQQLKRATLDTVVRLSRAAEYRDEDTGAHIQRVAQTSATIAEKLGLEKSKVEEILFAAPMHDIGKIGIPDSILLKPGRLTPQEREIMKQHTIIGGKILDGSEAPLLRTARLIALYHHEKWDGTGYPESLKGKQIPLPARIVAIADVFDALMSKRPYKQPLPLEKSLKIIKEERGKHFDPQVVDAFFECLDKILQIRNVLPDTSQSQLYKFSTLPAEPTH